MNSINSCDEKTHFWCLLCSTFDDQICMEVVCRDHKNAQYRRKIIIIVRMMMMMAEGGNSRFVMPLILEVIRKHIFFHNVILFILYWTEASECARINDVIGVYKIEIKPSYAYAHAHTYTHSLTKWESENEKRQKTTSNEWISRWSINTTIDSNCWMHKRLNNHEKLTTCICVLNESNIIPHIHSHTNTPQSMKKRISNFKKLIGFIYTYIIFYYYY